MRRRHLLTAIATAALLGSAGTQALASGDSDDRGAKAPPAVASQSSSSSQVLPITVGAGIALPLNLNVPIGVLSGPAQAGDVTQEATARADGDARGSGLLQGILG